MPPAAVDRSQRIARSVASGLWVFAFVSVGGSLLMWGIGGFQPMQIAFAEGPATTLAVAAISLVYASLGALLAANRHRSPIGWLLLAIGVWVSLLPPVNLLVADAYEVFRPVPPGTLVAAWLVSSLMLPLGTALLVLVVLLFPDGRTASRRWWAAAGVSLLGTALVGLAAALSPEGLLWYPSLPNPASAPASLARLLELVRIIGMVLMLAGVVLSALCLATRYRHGDEQVRRQLRWIVVGVAVMTAAFGPLMVGRYALHTTDAVGEQLMVLATAGLCLLPLTIAFAVRRHHLFDIDAVLGRTLVYVPLMAILGGLYTASIALFQRLFVSLTGNTSDAAVVISTLIMAATFTPVRQGLEGIVGRRFRPVPAGASEGRPLVGPAEAGVRAASPGAIDEVGIAALTDRLDGLERRLALLDGGPKKAAVSPVATGEAAAPATGTAAGASTAAANVIGAGSPDPPAGVLADGLLA